MRKRDREKKKKKQSQTHRQTHRQTERQTDGDTLKKRFIAISSQPEIKFRSFIKRTHNPYKVMREEGREKI